LRPEADEQRDTAMSFTNEFLDALGRWQRGWKQDPAKRAPIAAALVKESAKLAERFRQHNGTPLYRKRHLYRREDQRELVPLFLQGILDEGSPTSWSKNLAFAEKFDRVFDDEDPNSVAGAIFEHVPREDEVVLNVPALWDDPGFVAVAEAYQRSGGTEAAAIFYFRDERDQNEVILRAPLRLNEIVALSRPGDFESLSTAVGAETEEARDALRILLQTTNINLGTARFLSDEATRRVMQTAVTVMKARMEAWMALRVPTRPDGKRGRLRDAVHLGRRAANKLATFEGWRRLPGPDGLMEGRWSDGTVAYHRPNGAIWLY
jgi:hypothetical protein